MDKFEEAQNALDQLTKTVPNRVATGRGDNELFLYLEHPVQEEIPSEVNGFPVIVRVIGQVKAE
jgi:hypothetical protein